MPVPATALLFILAGSLALRVWLIAAGGQFYFPDEGRYRDARLFVDQVFAGEIDEALAGINYQLHFGSRVVALLPAAVEKLTVQHRCIPALFFGFFSVFNIYLIWRFSLRVGSGERVALLTAVLFSVSASNFYYARHILSYDLSMTLLLLGLIAGVKNEARWRQSCLCGLLASAGYLVYNGYWTLAALVLLVHIFHDTASLRPVFGRALPAGLCFVAPIVFTIALGAAFGGGDQPPLDFILSIAIDQGSFSEGGRLPVAYLWHAEHLMLLLWIFALFYCLWEARGGHLPRQAVIGIAGTLFVYGSLFVFSAGLQIFVVYGRLVRQLVPFCCLFTAVCLDRLCISRKLLSTNMVRALAVLVVLQTAVNFQRPLKLVFPAEFMATIKKEKRAIKAVFGDGRYTLLNAHHIYPEPRLPAPDGRSRMVLKSPHPLEYLPYQYEGHTPAQREKLRSTDISMRLVVSAGNHR